MIRIGIIALLFPLCSAAQSQYVANGAAINLGDGCYQFQADERYRAGTVWDKRQLSFADTFDIALEFIPDCSGGMDGMAIIFQSLGAAAGSLNDRLGYKGMTSSLAIEVDLFADLEDNDPSYQHMAIVVDGILDHKHPNQFGQPVRLIPGEDVLSDCVGGTVRVFWDPVTRTLRVYFDCELRLEQVIPADFPLLQSRVFWGYGASLKAFTPFFRVCKDLRRFMDSIPEQSVCPGEVVSLTAPLPDRTYVWRPGHLVNDSLAYQVIAKIDSATVLRVQMRDTCGMIFEEEIAISMRSIADQVDLGPADTLLCLGDSMLLATGVLEDARYRWSDGLTGHQRWIHAEGQYLVRVDQGLCYASDSIEVLAQWTSDLDLTADTVLCQGSVWQVDVGLPNGYEISWDDGTSGSIYPISAPGNYFFRATSPCGDLAHAIEVEFIDCKPVYIPNAFSPNGDGKNDLFKPMGAVPSMMVQQFVVADRWGNLVYSETGKSLGNLIGWDGNVAGESADGTFMYWFDFTTLDGKREQIHGTIHVLR